MIGVSTCDCGVNISETFHTNTNTEQHIPASPMYAPTAVAQCFAHVLTMRCVLCALADLHETIFFPKTTGSVALLREEKDETHSW